MSGPERYRNAGLFVALAAMWGSAFVGIKAGLSFFPPVLFAALRWDIAAVLLLAYASRSAGRVRPVGRAEWVDVAVSGALVIGGFQALLFLGEQHTTSAVAAVLVSTSPILVTAFSRLLLPEERLSALGAVGLAVGFVGVGLITRPDAVAVADHRPVGELLVLASAASFALGSVVVRAVEADVSLPLERREALATAVAAVGLHAASLGLGEPIGAVEWTPVGVGALCYLGVVPSAVGYLVYFDLLGRLGPIDVTLVSYANPVVAAALGWALLGERVHPLTVVGFVTVFVGFALLKRDELAGRLETWAARGLGPT